MGEHALESSVSYKITSHYVNNDVNNNDNTQSFETPRKNYHSYYSFGDTMTTTSTQNLYKIPPPIK